MTRKTASLGLTVVTALAVVLGTLTGNSAGSDEWCEYSQDKSEIYSYTFDEVFQGAQEMTQRLGAFADSADKDKGVITGHGMSRGAPGYKFPVGFEIHIEVLNAKPETKVSCSTRYPKSSRFCNRRLKEALEKGVESGAPANFNADFLGGLQKLLVTSK